MHAGANTCFPAFLCLRLPVSFLSVLLNYVFRNCTLNRGSTPKDNLTNKHRFSTQQLFANFALKRNNIQRPVRFIFFFHRLQLLAWFENLRNVTSIQQIHDNTTAPTDHRQICQMGTVFVLA